IFYRKLGNRALTPILIVHGLSYFSWDWLEVGQVLAAEREVVAMDMRGFGDSDWSAQKDYSVPAMAQDIVSVLDHLGWKRALLAMRGRRSDLYAAETVQKMKAANPRLQLVEVEAGHNIAGENPQGFIAALRPFLAAVEGKGHVHERH